MSHLMAMAYIPHVIAASVCHGACWIIQDKVMQNTTHNYRTVVLMCCLPRSTTCQILLYFIMLAHPVQSLFVQLRPHMMVSCSEEGEGLSRDSFLVCHILLSLIR